MFYELSVCNVVATSRLKLSGARHLFCLLAQGLLFPVCRESHTILKEIPHNNNSREVGGRHTASEWLSQPQR
jgi:hypothetical protein